MVAMNVSFAGCGFLGIYHIGVASCFREYAPYLLVNKIAGASVGSIAAAALICNVPLGQTTTDVLKVAVKARSRTLGPLHPGFDLNNIIKTGLERSLPENAHVMCSGRLFISCTRVPDVKNVIISQYNSRKDLIDAILCSCFIPLYSGLRCPEFDGEYLADGGLSNNLPVLDENTITVSPFAGEHDICPQDESCNIMQINIANTSISLSRGNLYRIQRILFPPEPEILSKMCQQGFDDALKYLQRHNLIACTRCMAIQSVLTLADACQLGKKISESDHTYDGCMDCRYRRQMALLGSLPDSVVKAIEAACAEVNKGVANWLFKNRPMRLLSILGLPYILPIDISILIFCKVWQRLPLLQKEIYAKFDNIILLIKTLLHKVDKSRHKYSAKFSCQLAITEFDYTEESVSSSYAVPVSEKPPHDTCTVTHEEEAMLPKTRSGLKLPESPLKQQRRSYAGFRNVNKDLGAEKNRRKSMCEVGQPERVLRNMKFGFVMDLKENPNGDVDKKETAKYAFQSLREDEPDINVIEITNKALSFERDCINQYHGDLQPESEQMKKILDITSNEAVMSYYYLDDNQTVKVTELYNVNEADTNVILPPAEEEEKADEQSHWAKEWYADPNISSYDGTVGSLADSFDDREFSMSDNDCDLKDEDDDAIENILCRNPPEREPEQKILNAKPKRKISFIVVK